MGKAKDLLDKFNNILEADNKKLANKLKKELNQIQKKFPKANVSVVIASRTGNLIVASSAKDEKVGDQVTKVHAEFSKVLKDFAKTNNFEFSNNIEPIKKGIVFITSIGKIGKDKTAESNFNAGFNI